MKSSLRSTRLRTTSGAVMRSSILEAFRPAPVSTMTVPDWADANRVLPSATSAVAGRWRTAAVEVARGPMMAVTEPGCALITVAAAVQLMKTELLLNILGYIAHLDPSPVMLVQPKQDAADKFSRERLSPMIRACPTLRNLFDPRVKMGEDSLSFKQFRGGFVAVEGAGSPMNLASRAVKVILCDEIDKYEMTKEGDPVALAEARTATYGENAKRVRVCSPTNTNQSRIWQSYQASDMRKPFIACPHCQHEMSPGFFRHVQWSKSESGDHFPMTAAIYCEACGCAWTEARLSRPRVESSGIRPARSRAAVSIKNR